MVICRPLSSVDFGAFTSAFNLAYSDYFMPISMTVPGFRSLMERDDLSLEASVAAVDEAGTIVGTGLLGIRGTQGWIGGMGVIPTQRRHGIGRQMMLFLIEQARQRGLSRIDLEVIEQNTGAYALYKQLGFADIRYLLVLERKPAAVMTIPAGYEIEEQDAESVLEQFATFHSTANSWQRALPSLQAITSQLEAWGVYQKGELAAYGVGWASEFGVRFVDLAAAPSQNREEAAQALLSHLHRKYPKAHGSFYNVSEDDPVLPALQATGYTTALRQIEMCYTIQPGA